MQIVRNKATNLVQYAFSDADALTLTATELTTPNLIVGDVKSSTHEILTVDVPDDFMAGAYSYDGTTWTVVNQDLIDNSPLNVARADKQQQIRTWFESQFSALQSEYTQIEIDTFKTQEEEARAYTADPTAPTPMLSGIATARGITVDSLAMKVAENAQTYKLLAAPIMGKKQRLEDALKLATTVTEVEAVIIE